MNTTGQPPNPYALPDGLPAPVDDGACDRLPGLTVPGVELASSDGARWNLADIARDRAIVYVYPATGKPGTDPIAGWDDIPGAPGCTVQSLGFREHFQAFRDLGYPVFGLSAQTAAEQAEFKQRTALPIVLLSDPMLLLQGALGLPTFSAQGKTFYKRLVLVLRGGTVAHVFYPVFPPDRSAEDVLRWLKTAGG